MHLLCPNSQLWKFLRSKSGMQALGNYISRCWENWRANGSFQTWSQEVWVRMNERKQDWWVRSQQKGVLSIVISQGARGSSVDQHSWGGLKGLLESHPPTVHGKLVLGSQFSTVLTCSTLRACKLMISIHKSHWYMQKQQGNVDGHQPSHKADHEQQTRKCLRYYLGFLFQCAESLIKNCMCLQVKHFFY